MHPGKEYSGEPNILERLAVELLRRWSRPRKGAVREIDESGLSELKRIKRWTIGWACLAGAISGGVLGGAEIILRSTFMPVSDSAGFREQLPYWATFIGLAMVVSGLEILFLYWNALRGTARISALAGLRLSGNPLDDLLARGLARAALEFPNPREPVFGIDPYLRVPRWKIWMRTLLYRMKVGVTSFFLRVLLRRMAGRAALRTFIPLVGIPVFAVWNGLITWWVLREAGIRTFGPAAVRKLDKAVADRRDALSADARRTIVEMAAEALVHSEDAHPNSVLLLSRLLKTLDVSPDEISVGADWESRRKTLGRLDEQERDLALRTLTAAVALNGRAGKSDVRLLKEAHDAGGRPFDRRELDEATRTVNPGGT